MKRFIIVLAVAVLGCGDQDALSPDAGHRASYAKVSGHGCVYDGATDSYECTFEFTGLEDGSTWDVWLTGTWYYYQCVNIHNGKASKRYLSGTIETVTNTTGLTASGGAVSGSVTIPPPAAPAVNANECAANHGPFTELQIGLAPAGYEILLVTPLPGPQ